METSAVLLEKPERLSLEMVGLKNPGQDEVVVRVLHSGISTGTEKLLWSGAMPPFPGLGYPLVPGYEAVGEILEAPKGASLKVGDLVFVPGSNGFVDAKGLFGGSARHLVTSVKRVTKINSQIGEKGVLYALAATARHALTGPDAKFPDLIIGHGALGRLLARITIIAGGSPPTVWEIDEKRAVGALGYEVVHPNDDEKNNYTSVFDASGRSDLLDDWIGHCTVGAEIVLAGFYADRINFAFPQAFMKEIKIRISAEWKQADMRAVNSMVDEGHLSLDGLITNRAAAEDAALAYRTAFEDESCSKMVLDWGNLQ